MSGPQPVAVLKELGGYRSKRSLFDTPIRLDGNEGRVPPLSVLSALEPLSVERVRRYPNKAPLEAKIAKRYALDPEKVLVTNGADDALDRIARAFVGADRTMVAPGPTFEMIERFVRLAGGRFVEIPWWQQPLPLHDIHAAIDASVSAITVVTPNNPTGLSATLDELEELATRYTDRLLVVDLAYAEFADTDLTRPLLAFSNVVLTRTFSKAWSLAGARVGYALSSNSTVIEALRDVGGPYPVSGPSLALAESWFEVGAEHVEASRAIVVKERESISNLLNELGEDPFPSQANYVAGRFRDAQWVADGLASLGIAIRVFTDKPKLNGCGRITCPQDPEVLRQVQHGLRAVLAPQVLWVAPGVLKESELARLEAEVGAQEADAPVNGSLGWWLACDGFERARAAGMVGVAWGATDEVAQRSGAARGFDSIDQIIAAWRRVRKQNES